MSSCSSWSGSAWTAEEERPSPNRPEWFLGLVREHQPEGLQSRGDKVLETLDLTEIHADGYGFQIETTVRALRSGARVVEAPITFHERAADVEHADQEEHGGVAERRLCEDRVHRLLQEVCARLRSPFGALRSFPGAL